MARCSASPAASLALLLALVAPSCHALGLFFRTPWAHEVSDAVFDSW